MTLTMVIMAAGMGSRFGGPKQLVPIGTAGETILDYNAHDAIRAGFDRLVVVTRAELEADVRARMQAGAARAAEIVVSLQEIPPGRTKPRGTADAVVVAAPSIDGPFAVANADDLYGGGSFRDVADHLRGRGDDEGVVVGYRLKETVPGGGSVTRALLSTTAEGMVTDLVETPGIERTDAGWRAAGGAGDAITGEEWVSVNLWGLPAWVLGELERAVKEFADDEGEGEVFLPDVAADLVRAGRLPVRLVATDEPWAGMTNPEDVELVEKAVRERWPVPLWS